MKENSEQEEGRERDGSERRVTLALIAGLLVCCLLPAIILSAGAGLTGYFLLHVSDLILMLPIVILILVAATLILRKRPSKAGKPVRVEEQKEGSPTTRLVVDDERSCRGE